MERWGVSKMKKWGEKGKEVEEKLTEEVGHGGIAGHFFFSFLLISKIRNNEEGELLR